MHRFIACAFVCLQIVAFTGGVIFSDTHWTTAIRLSEYQGYRSVSLLSYNVPPQTTNATFTFQAKTSGSSCSFREVHVYIQHGSYPLVNPYNETFPPHFYTNRTDAFNVKIEEDAEVVSYVIPKPRPGLWYFAAFLPKPSSDKIQQKGFDKSCLYGMVIIVESRGMDSVPEILPQKTHRIHLTQKYGSDKKLYRFLVPKYTIQYSLTINNCSVKHLRHRSHSDSSSAKLHPAIVSNTSDQSISGNRDKRSSDAHIDVYPTSLENLLNGASGINNNSNFVGGRDTEHVTKYDENGTTTTGSSATTINPIPTINPVPSICPVIAHVQSQMLPSKDSLTMNNCGNLTVCSLDVQSPYVEDWTYLEIQIDNTYNVSEVYFDLRIDAKECESLKFLLPKSILHHIQRIPTDLKAGPDQDACISTSSLGRLQWGQQTFNISYVLGNIGPAPMPEPLEHIGVQDYIVIVTSFSVLQPSDIGGTLAVMATLNLQSFDTKSQTVMVYVCLMRGSLPGGQTVRDCKTGVLLTVNMTQATNTVYVPYPEPGTWFLALNSQCFDKNTHVEASCTSMAEVSLDLGISGCVAGQCGQYGQCIDYISGVHTFSSCKCYAGWQGYGCTDGSLSRTRNEELTAVLLLTLSNMFFIPSAILAVYRKYFVEAAIYTITMFLSTFYHACDTSDLVYYCMMRYDILSFGDFLSSIISFWVTMLAMGKLPQSVRGFAQTVGAVAIAIGVEYDRHGLLVFAVPAGLAAVLMIGSWIFQCRQTRLLYPSKRYFLTHLLPGLVLAAVGLVLFAFLETDDNYKYTHSCWHVAMSLSIVFLLPPRPHTDNDDLIIRYGYQTLEELRRLVRN